VGRGTPLPTPIGASILAPSALDLDRRLRRLVPSTLPSGANTTLVQSKLDPCPCQQRTNERMIWLLIDWMGRTFRSYESPWQTPETLAKWYDYGRHLRHQRTTVNVATSSTFWPSTPQRPLKLQMKYWLTSTVTDKTDIFENFPHHVALVEKEALL